MGESFETKKSQLLRNNEYYLLQQKYDRLYKLAKENCKFKNLMKDISDEKNILLAYRNIKKNKGSVTVGTDNINIDYYKDWSKEEFVRHFQNKLGNYNPKSVRRVEIPKPNGKMRPLGIPCIDDRIIQQCIKQVLEPICEAKFHKHSYGFRPNRSTKHAIARSMGLMNNAKCHYVVDIDIKGFFDNVNHAKLKKQMWNLGIQDKNLIAIIGKILKSEIEGIGVPDKGTPQGGIISPLLSNIVLNELDWWLSNQWETFSCRHEYYNASTKYRELRKGNLKEFYFVRYADDFKIFCKDYVTAKKIYMATKEWLKERLGLEVSNEKSKITNLRKNRTEFLGIELYVIPSKNKYVCHSNIGKKSKKRIVENLKKQIRVIQHCPTRKEVGKLNSMILGVHNYYNCATKASYDFGDINFLVLKTLNNRLKHVISDKGIRTSSYEKLYGQYQGKLRTINGVTIYPIYGCKYKRLYSFKQETNNYTEQGRILVHKQLFGYNHLIEHLLKTSQENTSIEFNDNRISLMVGQQGICAITGNLLEIGNMECHHKKPKSLGGTDEYKNLVWICGETHKLIHCTKQETIEKYLNQLQLDSKGIKKLNSLRKQVGNPII